MLITWIKVDFIAAPLSREREIRVPKEGCGIDEQEPMLERDDLDGTGRKESIPGRERCFIVSCGCILHSHTNGQEEGRRRAHTDFQVIMFQGWERVE